MAYSIEYENDTGPDDGGFWEWWNVKFDGETIAKAETEAWAKAIVALLERAGEDPLIAAAVLDDERRKRRL